MAAELQISGVVKRLDDLIQKKNFIRGVEGEVQLLRDQLIKMQSYLPDANRNQGKSRRVRYWISSLTEVALDAEDVIEMFILKVKNQRKSRVLLERYRWFPNHVSHLYKIGNEIKSIRAKLDDIDKRREDLGINNLGELPKRSEEIARRRLAPWEKAEHLVGLEDDVKKLLEPIMDEENKGLSVVAVVEMAGIGKSTLAREVYNHPDVVYGRFDCRAWVVFNRREWSESIKHLILETTRSEQEKQELREEIRQLKESTIRMVDLKTKFNELLYGRLKRKTYFIVLEDCGESGYWDSIMTAFPNEQDETSRLLILTGDPSITNHCQSLHYIKTLDPDSSWELFLKKGLAVNSTKDFPIELEQIGRHIVEKCNGLPLAITLMGGLLSETRSQEEWEEALNELYSALGVEHYTSTIFRLSYRNLSPQVKSCFLCLGFFGENATITVKRLVNIMVGQGLVQLAGTTTVEEIARGYLDELINRNLVEVKDLTLDNRVKHCLLHREIELNILKRYQVPSLYYRHTVAQFFSSMVSSTDQIRRIHSLFVRNVEGDIMHINSIKCKSFPLLKVLHLDCISPLQRLPYSFQFLLRLKQLTIRRQPNKIIFRDLFNPSSSTLKLPTWLNSLKKLELLDLGIELVKFPKVALKMNRLRQFRVYCVRGHGPMITNSWKNVETLKYIMQEDWMRSNLSSMDGCQVRELGIIMVEESSEVKASLEKLESLVKLYIAWNYLPPIDATINIPLLANLTKLKLNGMLRECPTAVMLPPNITHLTLENSFLDEDPMQELSKLPKLSYLKLKNHSYTGEKMQVSCEGFTCLIGLHLRELYELRSFVIKEGGMPRFKLLQVRDCFALNTKNLANKSYMLQILDTNM